MRAPPSLALVGTCLAAFTATLDNTVVAVALRDVQADLGSSVVGLQGIVTSYTVALAGLLLLGGGVADRFGARRVLVAGTVLFAVASVLCAQAGSVRDLVGWRAVQGVGAALLLPGSLAVLAAAHPEPVRRQRALGVWAAVTGAALVAGPVAGGELVARHGWPSVFWVNLPLCAVVLLLCLACPEGDRSSDRLDVRGAALTCAALASATGCVVLAGRHGLDASALGLGAVAVLAGAVLVRAERRAPAPLLPSEVIAHPSYRSGVVAAFAAALAVFVILVFLSLFLQLVQERSAREAGLVLAALPVGLAAAALATARVRSGALVPVGLLVAGAGLLSLGVALSTGTGTAALVAWLAVIGAGAGVTTAPAVQAVLSGAGPGREGLASSSVAAARELGGVVAVGGLGAVAVGRLTSRLTDLVVATGVPSGQRQALLDALLSADKPEVRRQLVESVGAVRALRVSQGFQDAATASFVTSTKVVLVAAGAALPVLALLSARWPRGRGRRPA